MKHVAKCRSCGGFLPLDPCFDLPDMVPVCFPSNPREVPEKVPLALVECPFCTLVQLTHTVDQDSLYREFWYRSGVTETMRKSLADVVSSTVSLVGARANDSVLDIGANDGTLLSLWPETMFRLGFDPAVDICVEAWGKGIVVVPEYFSRKYIPSELQHRFRIISAISMFYDLDNPGEFLETVKLALHPEGVFVVQMNYLGSMMECLTVDNICHEHLCYYSMVAFDQLVTRHGMRITKVELNSVNGGSARFFVELGEPLKEIQDSVAEQEAALPSWTYFRERLENVKGKISSFLPGRKPTRRLGILGASTRGLSLLNFLALPPELFICAGERDPRKHERYYGATGIPIVSEAKCRDYCNTLLVLPWHFESEIVEREASFIQNGGELIFPLPQPRVIRAQGVEYL